MRQHNMFGKPIFAMNINRTHRALKMRAWLILQMPLLDMSPKTTRPGRTVSTISANVCLHTMHDLHMLVMVGEISRRMTTETAIEEITNLRDVRLRNQSHRLIMRIRVVVSNLRQGLQCCLAKSTTWVQSCFLVDVWRYANKDYVLVELCLVGVNCQFVYDVVVLLEIGRETQGVLVAAEETLQGVVVGGKYLTEQEHSRKFVTVVCFTQRQFAFNQLHWVGKNHSIVVVNGFQSTVFEGRPCISSFLQLLI